jgi:hypothetical protein
MVVILFLEIYDWTNIFLTNNNISKKSETDELNNQNLWWIFG